jgi:hypothetical protein
MTENEIGTIIIESASQVHRNLGPGLLESVYEVVLGYILNFSQALMKNGIVRAVILPRGIK